jgi:hypothetical protein
MQGGEMLARGAEDEFEALKTAAFRRYNKNKLYKETIDIMLDEAFRLGHYAGHLRGELHVFNMYKDAYGEPEDE